ncbi:hypothetical protein BCR43DRAFT_495527 [Syncephalastrum racemosum]|uniref:Uncharacterized protein n=1 Tax=Syncephalastrum racemosum TaxID=13706 RepID=A0A1X2H7A4_SYNRA|nr:hypothetical protein BCR43DRAFT_495527 [Syncephalastrum racemosum]
MTRYILYYTTRRLLWKQDKVVVEWVVIKRCKRGRRRRGALQRVVVDKISENFVIIGHGFIESKCISGSRSGKGSESIIIIISIGGYGGGSGCGRIRREEGGDFPKQVIGRVALWVLAVVRVEPGRLLERRQRKVRGVRKYCRVIITGVHKREPRRWRLGRGCIYGGRRGEARIKHDWCPRRGQPRGAALSGCDSRAWVDVWYEGWGPVRRRGSGTNEVILIFLEKNRRGSLRRNGCYGGRSVWVGRRKQHQAKTETGLLLVFLFFFCFLSFLLSFGRRSLFI